MQVALHCGGLHTYAACVCTYNEDILAVYLYLYVGTVQTTLVE